MVTVATLFPSLNTESFAILQSPAEFGTSPVEPGNFFPGLCSWLLLWLLGDHGLRFWAERGAIGLVIKSL